MGSWGFYGRAAAAQSRVVSWTTPSCTNGIVERSETVKRRARLVGKDAFMARRIAASCRAMGGLDSKLREDQRPAYHPTVSAALLAPLSRQQAAPRRNHTCRRLADLDVVERRRSTRDNLRGFVPSAKFRQFDSRVVEGRSIVRPSSGGGKTGVVVGKRDSDAETRRAIRRQSSDNRAVGRCRLDRQT